MALAQSPSIVTNGLVFYYDMNNVKKSWQGRPVTNQFTLPTQDVNGFGVQNSTFTRIRTGTYAGYDIQPTDYVWRYNVTGNDCPYHGWDIATTAGTVVTFSFDYYVDPTTTNYPVTNYLANFENAGSGVSGSVGDSTPSVKGVWKRAYFSSTASATGNSRCLLYPGACGGRLGDAGFILYKNPQVEFNAPGSIPTPFVAGTRSSTQAVLDLTNQKTITATSLTYASNGTFSFGGSGQRLDTNLTTFGNNATWEAWINGTSNVSTYNMFMGRYLPYFGFFNANSLYFSNIIGGAQQTIQTATNLTTNTWYHAVFTTSYNGTNTTMKIYTNGLETASGVFSGAQGLDGSYNFAIGDGYDASWYRFDGRVGSTKVYNRTLSPSEVQQNFAAQRGIYGV